MTDLHSPIEELNEQLQELLNEWTSEISLVLRELSDKRARVSELQAGFDKRGEKVAARGPRIQTPNGYGRGFTSGQDRCLGVQSDFLYLRSDVCFFY